MTDPAERRDPVDDGVRPPIPGVDAPAIPPRAPARSHRSRGRGAGRHSLPPSEKLKMLRPLKIRDFALLWSGLSVSLIGDGIFFIALPLQVLAIRNDATALTLALVAWTLPLVLFLVVGGVLSDRMDRRTMLMIANALQGVAIAGIGVLAVTDVLELWHIYSFAVLYGIAEALFGPAFGSIVPDIVPKDLLVEANALDNFSRPLALRVVGPALGGIIVGLFGLGNAFLVDAGTFVVTGIIFASITRRIPPERPEGGLIWHDVAEGFRFVRAHTWLWGTLLSTAVGLLIFYGPWQALVPFIITNKLEGSGTDLATVFALGGLGALLASVLIGQRNLPSRYMTTMFLVMGVGILMLSGFGLATDIWHAVLASFFMQALFTTGIITWNTTMHRLVPRDLLGRVSSLDWMVSTSLIPISLGLTGPLSVIVGADTLLVYAGIFGSIALTAFMFIPGIRDPEMSVALSDESVDGR